MNMQKELQFLIYQTPEEDISVKAIVKDETIWLTQKGMADLFDIDKSGISRHLKNIFDEQELDPKVVVAKIATTNQHGAIANKVQENENFFYNLDAIIAVGYRVNSKRATNFRIWATKVLKEFIIKGFVLDDNRLKQGEQAFSKDYFNELLERVRSIRASERRIWQQITDIFAECSIDYNKDSPITKEFYATVQNKFHYAVTGKTAPEIIFNCADKNKEHMGLTTWKNAPEGRIYKSDVVIAKNYLTESQIKKLERNVSGYFDYVEDLIENENTFTMEQFAQSVNDFLVFRKYKILSNKGLVSKIDADKKAIAEYEIFNKSQKYLSDFDKEIKTISKQKNNND